MRTFKSILRAAGFLGLNVAILAMLHFALTPISVVDTLLTQIERDGDYDTIFIGQSLGQTGLDPFLFSEEMDCKAINCCRRMMPVGDVQYMMEEAASRTELKTVVLEIDPAYWPKIFPRQRQDVLMLYHVNWQLKLRYLVDVLGDCHLKQILDYQVKPADLADVSKNLKVKLTKDYLFKTDEYLMNADAMNMSSCYEYNGRGFRFGVKQDPNPKRDLRNFKPSEMHEDNVETFEQMVAFCEKNGIQLICMMSVLPEYQLTPDYHGNIHDYFAELCERNNVPFYDMSFVKEQFLPKDNELFVDWDGHAMGTTAQAQTSILVKMIQGEPMEEYFYQSYEEVLNSISE